MRGEITTDHEITMYREITTGPELTMGGEITMYREIMMATGIMMDGEIMMRRGQQTTAMGHGMDALRAGRFRVETARPTKVRLVADGARGMAARTVTRFKAASVSRILDHISQMATALFFSYL
jgi:hypothetical protein